MSIPAVLLLVLFPRSRSPVVGVLGLCWMWQYVPFAQHQHPVVGVLGLCWLLWVSFLLSTHLRPQAVYNLPLCVSVCASPTCPAPHGVPGDLRCTMTTPSSLVLPTPPPLAQACRKSGKRRSGGVPCLDKQVLAHDAWYHPCVGEASEGAG